MAGTGEGVLRGFRKTLLGEVARPPRTVLEVGFGLEELRGLELQPPPVVVDGRGRPQGVVDLEGLLRVALGAGEERPCWRRAPVLPQGLPVVDAWKRLSPLRFPLLVVDEEGKLVGVAEEAAFLAACRRDLGFYERALLATLRAVHEGIVVVDRGGIVRMLNPEAERLLGVRAGEVEGKPIQEVFPQTRLPEVLESGRVMMDRVERVGQRSLLVSRTPIPAEDGGVVGAVAAFRDISELERALEELHSLQELTEMMELAVEGAMEGVIVADLNGTVIYANQRCAALLGLSKEEIRGKNLLKLVGAKQTPAFLRTGVPEVGRVVKIGGRQMVVSRVPIVRAGRVVGGAAFLLFTVEELDRLSQRVHLLEEKVNHYRQRLHPRVTFEDILGNSPAMVQVKQMACRAARTDLPVLLVGETGTGKELFARAIHQASSRAGGDFVAVNCAAIPAELLEAELFGYEPGAFTGARRGGKPGKLELADGGTLFLDEIADMPPQMQAKLLRVLEEGKVWRVGATHPRRVDFRLICATHEDLDELVRQGRFRSDLLYRIDVFRLELPPLRSRGEDIRLLAEHFLRQAAAGRNLRFSEEAWQVLERYRWPGNVRQLKNAVEFAASLAVGEVIRPEVLPLFLHDAPSTPRGSCLRASLERAEREMLLRALRESGGNLSQAARRLGISRTLIYKKLHKHGLRRPR